MAVVKHKFNNLSRGMATMIFTAMASTPLAFLTTGIVGKITFYFLQRWSNWLINQGLVLANVGIDFVKTASQKKDYDQAIEEAIQKVLQTKHRLTKEEQDAIDEPVKRAFRRFVKLV